MIALLILLAALQAADWSTTRTILALGGYERNPAVRWLMGGMGTDPALALKTALVCAIGALLLHWPWPFLAALTAAYAWVVWSNLRVIARLRARSADRAGRAD